MNAPVTIAAVAELMAALTLLSRRYQSDPVCDAALLAAREAVGARLAELSGVTR
jgi:hypothetical protein